VPADQFHRAVAASQGKPVNIKKGQFLSPWEMQNVVDKARSTGNAQIMVCERGFSFGYNNLVSDMRSLAIMRGTGCPVVFDATHSVQLPGGQGDSSGGQREFVPVLARAAVAAGRRGIFMETHPDPAKALSDGPNAWPLARMASLLATLKELDAAVKKNPSRSLCYESYRRYPRPRDHRFARQSHRRGRCGAGFRRRRPRGGALRRLHRIARGGGIARRRSEALRRQGRAQGGRPYQRSAARSAAVGTMRPGSARTRRQDDRRPTAPNKSKLGANAILAVSLAAAHAAARDRTAAVPHFGGAARPDACRCP
jgi:hypothetical protein